MVRAVTFGTASAGPGTRAFGWLEVCMMADGAPLHIPVHVFAGNRPGPRLTILSAQHGYEITEVEACRQLMELIDPQKLKGTLVVVPIANPIAFEGGTRCAWQDSLFGDNGNMNRIWPGKPDGWITERIVHLLAEQTVKGSDFIIDLHDGDTASAGMTICYGYAFSCEDEKLSQTMRETAIVSGFDIVIKRAIPTLAGSLGAYSLTLGIPFFACEAGEFYGFQLNEGERAPSTPSRPMPESGVTSVVNIMKYLGMLEGEPQLPSRQVLISPERHLRPGHGGFLYSNFSGKDIGRVIPQGTLLGTLMSPYTFEKIEEYRAPFEKNLIIATPHHQPFERVNTGDYAFMVADMSTAEWITR